MDPQKSDRPSGPARVDAVMVTSQTSSAAVPQVNEGRRIQAVRFQAHTLEAYDNG